MPERISIRRLCRAHLVPAAIIFAISPIAAPALLAFPYSQRVGEHHIYSTKPITPQLRAEVIEADRLVAASISGGFRKPDQSIFLTDGGWRWVWLANRAKGAFAITRAINDAVLVNRSDDRSNQVFNGAKVAGQRSLSGVIAHEMTHGAIRAHFGLASDLIYPAELREGYCDYVAGGGSLSDEEAKRFIADGQSHPALPYWKGRKRVEAELANNGNSIDRLFDGWG